MSLISEIGEQPQMLAHTLASNRVGAQRVADLAEGSTHVVLAARGTSDNAGRYAQYVWGTRNRLTVALTTPSLFSVYEEPPRLGTALVVGISQSGESPDIVSVLAEGRRQGRPTVAITNRADSPLADTADVVLDLSVGEETAVAATKTYTAQLAVVALVSEAMAGRSGALEVLPSLVRDALGRSEQAGELAESFAGIGHAAVLGRGYNQSTAFEWALKLQELAHVVAQPFSTADFLHGPIAVVEPGYPVLAVAAKGPAAGDVLEVLATCHRAGADLCVIGNHPGITELTTKTLDFPTEVEEWLSPIPAIVLGQLFTYHFALAKGLNPDSPRGLSKVTKTF